MMTAAAFGLDGWPERLALVGVVIGVTLAAFFLIGIVTRRLSRRAGAIDDPTKWQQRRTAVTLLATMLRYIALVAAIAAVISIVAGAGSLGALGGSAVVAVTIGLASQRLLTDVIAGFFILFEGQFAVGDTITVEPSKITGVVEELGIRATLIREVDGSHSYVPNGQITAVRRFNGPDTTLVVTVVTREPESAAAAMADLAALATPTHGIVGPVSDIERESIGDGVAMVRARVGASSTLVTTATELITAALAAQPDGVVVGSPSVVALAPATERPRTTRRA